MFRLSNAQNETTEVEWDLAKILCYCEVTSMCKLLTANTPLNRGRKFLKCAKENDGCDFWCWADELRFCRCKAGFCKIRTSKMPMSLGQKFYCCPSSTRRKNPGCEYNEWMQKSKASKTKKKLVDDGATTSSEQDKDIMKEIILEVEIEHRVAQRQVEVYGSFLKKFGGFKI
ncbi:DNA-binding protein HEXBP [Iris pallida]|uniref:DNA-binding protein HEXBP n=1 Tax=Iris pallida TaxID=29817 RepID=A0AAX6DTA6_IRIPA|nr:DNA-binding protein HEXBP [Iris pallida]